MAGAQSSNLIWVIRFQVSWATMIYQPPQPRVMLGAPALLLVHPTILINSVNAPVLSSSFLSWFRRFFHLRLHALFFTFSLSCWFFIVERGSASVEVKVLRVGGDCCGGSFVVGGTPSTRCCWVSVWVDPYV